MTLDAIDRRILAELQRDGRITNQALAEKVGLSATPCLRRVKRLEEAGILRGYVAVVDQKAVDLPVSVFISIKLERQREEDLDRFAEALPLARGHGVLPDDRAARLSHARRLRRPAGL